ncbi:hypothetical protein JCM19231_4373 [Vibrio ishigakensis]|uniref:Uncharacterized protein n=1 Tax=Vibrio ishigakensis TaxID=1481914 RepID=A0A0B8NXQ7_9VIBR|nr:hypothetical protein [Vibrio ishigakensis]GAM55474.1 hypothetical protein JCM19231_4373 [Vibrio ishigakensis]GAM76848.1 hypothetical protein JCM19241_5744 [Vibrio ishigakensis]
MDVSKLEKGMWVESELGVGKVLVVDKEHHTVLLEGLNDEQWAEDAQAVEAQEQMHVGCDKYY